MENVEIGERFKTWGIEKFKSRAGFARALKISSQALTKYFSGSTLPGKQMREKLKELGADVEYIMTGRKEGEKKWYEKVDPAKMPPARGVENLPSEQVSPMMLSSVRAGEPQYAYSEVKAYMPVGKQYHEKSYHVQAVGDSMTGAGIVEGDWLLVDEEREAVNGNIVLARVGDKLTIKRLKKNGDCVLLNPENPDYEPIPCNDDVDIVAVVIKKEVMFV